MSVQGINPNVYTTQVNSVSGTGKVGGMKPPPPPMGMGGMGGMDGMSKSGPADMMNKLQDLQEEDPEKFQTVMDQIADEIEAAAAEEEESTGGASMLKDLAAKFREAAESGDLSILQPPSPPSFSESQEPTAQYQMQEDSARSSLIEDQQSDARSKMQALFTKIFNLVDEATNGTSAVS